MSIKFRWLGYVCFEMVLPSGKVLIIDPYIDYSQTSPIRCQEVTGADYIAITHGHFDHVTDLGPLVQRFNSKVICSHQVAEPLARFFNFDPANMIKVTAGATIVFDDLKIEVKKAEHISLVESARRAYKRLTGKEAKPGIALTELQENIRSLTTSRYNAASLEMMNNLQNAGVGGGEQLNFVFQTSDNLRIYIYSAGPYEFLRQEVIQAHPNVFFIQLGGVDLEKAAEVAALSGAEIIVPTHHDGDGVEEAHIMAQEMAKHLAARSKAHFVDIIHGKWYEIGLKVSQPGV